MKDVGHHFLYLFIRKKKYEFIIKVYIFKIILTFVCQQHFKNTELFLLYKTFIYLQYIQAKHCNE